jgi:hypothetical protein
MRGLVLLVAVVLAWVGGFAIGYGRGLRAHNEVICFDPEWVEVPDGYGAVKATCEGGVVVHIVD